MGRTTRTSLKLAILAVAALVLLTLPAAASASSPIIESDSVSHITSTDAMLEAQINTGEGETTYQFSLEYGCGVSEPKPGEGTCWAISGIDVPAGELPASSEPQSVSVDLNQAGVTLQPSTKYRYRVEATNAAGMSESPDQTFTTPPASSPPTAPPSIESESASNITPIDATLEAEINLHEAPAGVYYQFQLVNDPSEYASEILCPPTLQPGTDGCIGPQGSDALPIGFLPGNTLQPGATLRASLSLASAGVTLQPATTYHFRVLAARAVQTEDTIQWEEPTVFGADQTFTTPSEPLPSQTIWTGDQYLAIVSPSLVSSPSTSSLHRRRHHRRHKRGLHRSRLQRASRTD